jgi:hypothetical protein
MIRVVKIISISLVVLTTTTSALNLYKHQEATMQSRRLDVLEILEKEKEYYLEQIKRINIALAALKGELPQDVVENKKILHKKGKVQWKAEIDKLYETNNVFTVDEIQDQLIENGIVEAKGAKGKSSISTTLIRKTKKGELKKISAGTYSVVNKSDNEESNSTESKETIRTVRFRRGGEQNNIQQ